MTYVIGLNGPPGAGKNAVARELVTLFQRVHDITPVMLALADPLRVIASQLTGVDMLDEQLYAQAKATPFPHLAQDTGRQVMIRITEEYLKPRYGRHLWVDATIRRINALRWRKTPENARVVIVTDVGFICERIALAAAFPKSAFIELDRPGCSYDGDSRQSVVRGRADPGGLVLLNLGVYHHQLVAIAGRVHDFVLNRLQWDLPAAQIALPHIDSGD